MTSCIAIEQLSDFLADREPLTPRRLDGFPVELTALALHTGHGSSGLEVLVAAATSRPTFDCVRRAHKARRGNRASPVLIVAGYSVGEGAARAVICGPDGASPLCREVELSVAERICDAALGEPTHQAASRWLRAALSELDSQVPGMSNHGLFATHELRQGVPARNEWRRATADSEPMLTKRGRGLVEALGYTVDSLAVGVSMLSAGGHFHAVAVFCADTDAFETPSSLFSGSSPVAHALAFADQKRAPWVVATRGPQIRLYAARPDVGVGGKGRAETYFELDLALLSADEAGYLQLIFSPGALARDGTVEAILKSSERYAADLAVSLRERVFHRVVPTLVDAVAARMKPQPTREDLDAAYEQVMTILFRLLFVAYAEDRGLLPVDTNSSYETHSLARITKQIIDARKSGQLPDADTESHHWWDDITQLWEVIAQGKKAWGVPAYNGGLSRRILKPTRPVPP